MNTLKSESGMTLIELVVYMALVALFMMAALFLLKAGNDFSTKARESMRAQTDIRLASISIKNALKRYDYKDGFELAYIDEAYKTKGKKLSFKKENDNKTEVYSLYFDKASKQLMQSRVAKGGSNASNTNANVILKPICTLEDMKLSMNVESKTVTLEMTYIEDDESFSYKEVFHYKTKKIDSTTK